MMNSYLMILRTVWIMASMIAICACHDDPTCRNKTPVEFIATLATDGLSWKESDQLLIAYSTDTDSMLTTCYQYDQTFNRWKAASGEQILYAEDVKELLQVEGFGQSCVPPTGLIYADQSLKENYLRTRHLLCSTPQLSTDKKMLTAIMESRAVHVVLKLFGNPEQVVMTLKGEIPVKAYKNIGDKCIVFATHLKLWHLPGISMDADNNRGTVLPRTLFGTIDYVDKVGISKTFKLYYTVKGSQTLSRGDQLYLTATTTVDSMEIDAIVSKAWTNTNPDVWE